MTGVVIAWTVELGLITYRGFKKGAKQNVGGLPLPADYLATFAIFGVLGLFSGVAEKPATAVAWGYVAATALNLFDPTLNKAPTTVQGTDTPSPTGPVGPLSGPLAPTIARPPTAHNISN
jgi:hypothetical protein